MAAANPLEHCAGFEWDDANTGENRERHRVGPGQAEDIFFNEPLVIRGDINHSKTEKRCYALGRTGAGRGLFVAFAVRRNLIRVISARDMNRSETQAWKMHEKENS